MGRPRDPFSPVLAHPDATESAVTVTPGGFQLESGYTFGRVEGVSIHTAGEVLLRIGDFERALVSTASKTTSSLASAAESAGKRDQVRATGAGCRPTECSSPRRAYCCLIASRSVVNVASSDSRGIESTNGPTIQPRPNGMLRLRLMTSASRITPPSTSS